MCFTYEVLEPFCNLPILAAKPKNSLHRTPHFPMTPQRAHPTAPNPRYPMAQRRVRSKHHTCTTPQRRARAFSHHCTRAAPWRRARIDPRRRTCATPCCQAPCRSQYRAGSVSPPLGTAPELPEVWKQKSDQNCNFFAIGNCRRCPNHGSSPENEAKRPLSASFPLYGRRERAANRKKVAKAPGFLFS